MKAISTTRLAHWGRVVSMLGVLLACDNATDFEANQQRANVKTQSDSGNATATQAEQNPGQPDIVKYTEAQVPSPLVPPSILAIQPLSFTARKGEDVAFSLKAPAQTTAQPLRFELVQGPDKGEIKSFDGASGKGVYRVASNQYGSDSFRFRLKAADGSESPEESASVEIINRPPTVAPVALTLMKNTVATIRLVPVDPDRDSFSLSLERSPSSGTSAVTFDAAAATATLVVAPAANFAGKLEFEVVASDAELDSLPALIALEYVDAAPEAKEDVVMTSKDLPVTFKLRASDADAGDKLSFALAKDKGEPQGAVELNPDNGFVRFTPALNFTGETGFVYSVSDGRTSSEASIRILVGNQAPTVQNIAETIGKNEELKLDLRARALDPEAGHGNNLSFRIVGTPTRGSASINAETGKLTYKPHALGTDSFQYVANDGAADSAAGRIDITIQNAKPIITSTPLLSFRFYKELGETVDFPVTLRDFKPWNLAGGHNDFGPGPGVQGAEYDPATWATVAALGMVAFNLGPGDRPVLEDQFYPGRKHATSKESFSQWYTDVPGVNQTISDVIKFKRSGAKYVFNNANEWGQAQMYWPLRGKGWQEFHEYCGQDNGVSRNCFFTTEVKGNFIYFGNETFTFTGDDDFWLFINKRLAVDIGGCHGPIKKSINLAQEAAKLGLTVGKEYQFHIFHAERAGGGSNFEIETTLSIASDDVYGYAVKATDGDGDVITYRLLQAPEGMRIDASTGQIHWKPRADQVTTHTIKVEASDSSGARAEQTYQLQVL